ncbi:DUF4446 family protein [Nocardiopsis sp. CNT-189]|uniref:DUF4446 family protein n=1 Tax=Nocardiopsis oceanisediminis TaxID=2816862 RepID=UPI003B3A6CE1
MLTTILAVLGLVAGVCGLAVGGWAVLNMRKTIHECEAVVRRILPESGGVDPRAVRDVGLVRYDALEEMSGARSFSLVLLDAAGDGVVVTSINGRTESRTYAKLIEAGRSEEALSPEEYRAIRSARLGRGPGAGVGAAFPAPADEPEEPAATVRPLAPRPRAEAGEEPRTEMREEPRSEAREATPPRV